MPIIKSAKKSLRQDRKKRKRNIQRKDKIKKLVKKAQVLISEKKIDEAKKLLPQIYKAFDKAAKKGTVKKNTASRRKSRLTKSLQSSS